MMRKSILWMAAAAVAAVVPVARAQESGAKTGNVFFYAQSAVPPTGAVSTFEFVSSEAGIPGKVVKNAPYSATAVTESVQTLADGNRITNSSSSSVARDSEGRTRREQSLPAIGPWASDGPAPKLVTISDPVANVTYMLEERTKTARKLPARNVVMGEGAGVASINVQQHVKVEGAPPGGAPVHDQVVMIRHAGPMTAAGENRPTPKVEQLGQRNIEGVVAEGTRTTVTLPAGAVGNERPIEIMDERWYSSELQTTIMTKHSDPRMGESTFKLTKVSRGEPAKALFEVPSDYKVVDGGSFEYKVDSRQ